MGPVSFDFLGFHQFWGDGEGGESFEEDGPAGKDCVGGYRGHMSEEAGALRGGLACGYPRRFEPFERGVPGEGEEVEARQHHRQKSLAMAEIVFELVAVIFHHVEAFVLDLPARPAAGDDFGDILFRDGKARDPCHGIFDAALCIDDLEAYPVDEHGVLAVAQRHGLEPAIVEGVGGLALADFFVVTKGLGALDEVVQRRVRTFLGCEDEVAAERPMDRTAIDRSVRLEGAAALSYSRSRLRLWRGVRSAYQGYRHSRPTDLGALALAERIRGEAHWLDPAGLP